MTKSCLYSIVIFVILSISVNAQDDKPGNLSDLSVINRENVGELARLMISYDLTAAADLAWSTDNTKLLIATYDGMWLLNTEQMELNRVPLEEIVVYDVEFLGDTNRIAGYNFRELLFFDLGSDDTTRIVSEPKDMRGISHDAALYAVVEFEWNDENDTAIGGKLIIYEVTPNKQLFEIPVTFYEFCYYACSLGVVFSPDNSQIAFSSPVPEIESGFVDLATGVKKSIPTADHFGLWGMTYSPDGKLVASTAGTPGYIAETLLLIDTSAAEIVAEKAIYNSSSPAFSSGGDLLVIGAYDDNAPNPDESIGLVRFFEVERLLLDDETNPVMTVTTARPPSAIQFSPDGRILAMSDERSLSLWGVQQVPK